jgi:copper(I)-binding protein
VARTQGGAAVPVAQPGSAGAPGAQATTRPAAQPAGQAAATVAPAIAVEGAWARAAERLPDAAGASTGTSAVYLVIRNRGSSPDVLKGATGDVADAVEVHRSWADNGVMRMGPAGDLEVPAGGQLVLEQGGLHVMLIGLRQDLKEGANISITLQFAIAGDVTVEAPVRPRIAPAAGAMAGASTPGAPGMAGMAGTAGMGGR